jgi:hypothetical protein
MKITLEIKSATVAISSGTDHISLMVDLPTTFPELKYPTFIKIDARHGYGEQYCKEILGIEPKVIQQPH